MRWILTAAFTLLLPVTAAAQATGFRAALLEDLQVLEQKYIGLARAVPEADYGWRPAEGVRSIGQVYGHITAANYMIAGLFGDGRPADVGIPDAPRNLEQVTAKADLVALLEHVFPHVRAAIEGTPDSELDREITLFGQPSTVRKAMLLLTTHMHEHLGQSIAYARSVGVTPPWSR